MKNYIYSIFILALSSCSSYQISTLKNVNQQKNSNNNFVFENDTLRITYNFKGENAPLNIHVFNKLKEPLFIDWNKSALILNDASNSFSNKKVNFNATGEGVVDRNTLYRDYVTSQSITGSATLPLDVDFIPPNASLEKQPLTIANQLYKNIP